MIITLTKGMDGCLRPSDPEAVEKLAKLKVGAGVRCEVKQIRNYKFHQRLICLMQLAFEHFSEYGISQVEYKGVAVTPCFERFRKDLTILAGHYEPHFDIRGNVRLTAKSLSFARCSEEEAHKIYSDVINAALKNVYRSSMTADELDARVNEILAFS